jgi:hypothetical protein
MRRVELMPGPELSLTRVSSTALAVRVHSEGAIAPRRKYLLLIYFKYSILLNRRQGRSAEEHKEYNFELFYRQASSNVKADILSRCQAFTSREWGTTSATNQSLLQQEQ